MYSPAFYLTSWQLSTYDISPPVKRYEEETATSRQLAADGRHALAHPIEKKRESQHIHLEKEAQYEQTAGLLPTEMKHQTAARKFTMKRPAREKQFWFSQYVRH